MFINTCRYSMELLMNEYRVSVRADCQSPVDLGLFSSSLSIRISIPFIYPSFLPSSLSLPLLVGKDNNSIQRVNGASYGKGIYASPLMTTSQLYSKTSIFVCSILVDSLTILPSLLHSLSKYLPIDSFPFLSFPFLSSSSSPLLIDG